eukprot:Tbor_TRINITY_DN5163_c0_g2::TRINITY_DN5163_c0_g2_i1::g.25831::m.25831
MESFEGIGVHPEVCAALSAQRVLTPSDFQKKVLLHTVRDFYDVMAESRPTAGCRALLAYFAAHCVLMALPEKKYAVIVANDTASCMKMVQILRELKLPSIDIEQLNNDGNTQRSNTARHHQLLGSAPSRPRVICTTFATVSKWHEDDYIHCSSVLVEDCVHCDATKMDAFLATSVKKSTEANLFLLSSQPPCDVDPLIRYIMGRRKRRFYHWSPALPSYTYLLAVSAAERQALCNKLTQLKGLKRILLLTHNREVRDLKTSLSQIGMKTFSIQRGTSATDRFRTITDFLRSSYAVLVAMDAFTNIDLLDVDAVIQYYPPQKSMSEVEWSDYMNCLKYTASPRKTTLFVTLLGTEDMTLASYFMKRTESNPLVLSIPPTHPRFADCVRNPLLVADEVTRDTPDASRFPTPRPSQGAVKTQENTGNKRGSQQNGNVADQQRNSGGGRRNNDNKNSNESNAHHGNSDGADRKVISNRELKRQARTARQKNKDDSSRKHSVASQQSTSHVDIYPQSKTVDSNPENKPTSGTTTGGHDTKSTSSAAPVLPQVSDSTQNSAIKKDTNTSTPSEKPSTAGDTAARTSDNSAAVKPLISTSEVSRSEKVSPAQDTTVAISSATVQ